MPIGCILTVAAFTNAYRAMRRGDHAGVQRMFRARVAAQAFTVCAMVAGGVYFSRERKQERELWKLERDRDAEEKRQRWIRELEARDEEDRALRERLERRRKRAAERGVDGPGGAGGGVSEAVAHARAGTKGSKEAEGASGEGEPKMVAEVESGDELLSVEKKEGKSFFGSLGGLLGGSGDKKETPSDPRSEPEVQKVDPEAAKK